MRAQICFAQSRCLARCRLRHQTPPFLFICNFVLHSLACNSNIGDQRATCHYAEARERKVHRQGIAAKRIVRDSLQCRLGKVEQARDTDDRAVNGAKRCEAEDFDGIITAGKKQVSDNRNMKL